MAFTCDFSSITSTTAIFTADFTGGQATYSGWRMVKLSVFDSSGTGMDAKEEIIVSTEKGSGSSHFTYLLQGLKPEREYGFNAEIGYSQSASDKDTITWLGQLDEGGTIKYSASGSFETTADGSTSYFTASELEAEKYSLTFYASFTYDETISPHVTEMNKLTMSYSIDPSMSTGVTTLRFDSTSYTATSDTEGIYKWDDIQISGLKAGTTYYWRAYCCSQSQAGSVSGIVESSSTTLPPEPNALSLKILPIEPTKAILTGTYYDAETESLEDFSTLHFKLSTNGGESWSQYKTCAGVVDSDNHFVIFQKTLDLLDEDTEYSYRAYVGSVDPWE